MIPTYGYGKGSSAGSVACFGYARRSTIIQLIGRATHIFQVAFYRAVAHKVNKA